MDLFGLVPEHYVLCIIYTARDVLDILLCILNIDPTQHQNIQIIQNYGCGLWSLP